MSSVSLLNPFKLLAALYFIVLVTAQVQTQSNECECAIQLISLMLGTQDKSDV